MSLMASKSFKKNDFWYKIEVVRKLESGKESVPDVAAQIGIHPHTLYRWISEHKSGDLDKKKKAAMASKYPKASIISQGSVIPDKNANSLSLEKEVELLRLKVLAYETMIEVAEAELGISIKKKSSAKPSTGSVSSTPSTGQPPVSSASADGLATAGKPTIKGKKAYKPTKRAPKQ
jgi:transposase-like protein